MLRFDLLRWISCSGIVTHDYRHEKLFKSVSVDALFTHISCFPPKCLFSLDSAPYIVGALQCRALFPQFNDTGTIKP